jgi:tRNA threonylcarbamoyladenosine biosynthesis protein TsaB
MLLAVETSSRAGSVALYDATGLVEAVVLGAPRDHAQGLAPAVQALLAGRFEALSAYAVSVGPGSFTGLRIGVAFVKGLALVYPRPVVPVGSLEVLAAGVPDGPEDRVAVLDARRGNVFAARFGAGREDPTLPAGLYPAEALAARLGGEAGLVWVGDGVPVLGPLRGSVAPEAAWTPRAEVLAALAWPRRASGIGAEAVAPVYHQRSGAEESLGICAVD